MLRDQAIEEAVTRLTAALVRAQQAGTVRPAFSQAWQSWAHRYMALRDGPGVASPEAIEQVKRKLAQWFKVFSAELPAAILNPERRFAAGAAPLGAPLRTANAIGKRKPVNYGAPNSVPEFRRPASLSMLRPGEGLIAGDGGPGTGSALASPSGQFVLSMRKDGNLSLVDVLHGSELWHTGTYATKDRPNGGAVFTLQPDGNAVIYDTTGRPMWALDSNGKGAALFRVQNDGNLSMNAGDGRELWSSDTWQHPQNIQAVATPAAPPAPQAPAVAPVAPAPAAVVPQAAPVAPVAAPVPQATTPAPQAAPVAPPPPFASPAPQAAPTRPYVAPAPPPQPYRPPIFAVMPSPAPAAGPHDWRSDLAAIPAPVKVIGAVALVSGLANWGLRRGRR